MKKKSKKKSSFDAPVIGVNHGKNVKIKKMPNGTIKLERGAK